MGPNVSCSEYVIVKALLGKYTQNGKIIDSELKNKLRGL